MIDRSRVRSARLAVAEAEKALKVCTCGDCRSNGCDPDCPRCEDPSKVYAALEKRLNSSLGNSGLSADFVNSAYLLSREGERTRFGKPIPKKGMLYLFEEDEPGEYSIIRMKNDEGDVEESPVASGKVADGSLDRALERLGQDNHGRFSG